VRAYILTRDLDLNRLAVDNVDGGDTALDHNGALDTPVDLHRIDLVGYLQQRLGALHHAHRRLGRPVRHLQQMQQMQQMRDVANAGVKMSQM
jgi:hypothetical protein